MPPILAQLEPRLLLSGFDVYNPVTLIADAVTGYYAIPTAMNWDGDGDWDLLVGEWGSDNAGHVRRFQNSGSNASPSLTFVANVNAGPSPISLGAG